MAVLTYHQKVARQETLVILSVKGPPRLLVVLQDRPYHSKRIPNPETRTARVKSGGPAFRRIARPAIVRNVNWTGLREMIRFVEVY